MPSLFAKIGDSITAYTINFQPIGRRGRCQNTESLLDCAHQLGIGISAICGGKGNCYSCKVRVLSGTVSELTSSELEVFLPQELADGWRLACRELDGVLGLAEMAKTGCRGHCLKKYSMLCNKRI